MAKILIKPWSFSKSEDRIGKGITKRGNLALRVFRKMICTPIWVVIPVRHTAQGPLCGYRVRLPRHLVEPCAGNEEVYRCPDGKIILIRLCVRVWEFSRDGYPYRCTLLCHKPAFARSLRVIRHQCGSGPTDWGRSSFSLVCDGPGRGWIQEGAVKVDGCPCMLQDASQLAVLEYRWRGRAVRVLGVEKIPRKFVPLLSFVPRGFLIQWVVQSLSVDLVRKRGALFTKGGRVRPRRAKGGAPKVSRRPRQTALLQ